MFAASFRTLDVIFVLFWEQPRYSEVSALLGSSLISPDAKLNLTGCSKKFVGLRNSSVDFGIVL